MEPWRNRPVLGERRRITVDPETGIVTAHNHEHVWLAPFRGLCDLASDLRYGRLTTAAFVFLMVIGNGR